MIEVMTILVVVGALASIVLPMFQNSADDAKDATLMHNLKHIRHQIELFRTQHKGRAPGFGGMHPILHLVLYSKADGAIYLVPNPNFPYGPYLTVNALTNPFNQGLNIMPSNDPAAEVPNDELLFGGAPVGWFYDAATGRIAPNVEGTTSSGTPRIEL